MKRNLQGHYKIISTVGETVKAFIPAPLPPVPPIEWTSELREKFDQAHLALGRLDSVSKLLPDTTLFLYMYVRKEAVLSSMIEGTQSSLSDLLLFERRTDSQTCLVVLNLALESTIESVPELSESARVLLGTHRTAGESLEMTGLEIHPFEVLIVELVFV